MSDEYTNVGGLWRDEETKKVSGKLDNGMRIYLLKNDRKQPGENTPDFRLRMKTEDARKLGLLKVTDVDEVDIDSIPF